MKLAEMRRRAGVSQVDLAKHVKKSDRTIQSWESGKASPPANVVWEMCESGIMLLNMPIYLRFYVSLIRKINHN